MSVYIEAHNLKGSVSVSCEENFITFYYFKTSEFSRRPLTAKNNCMFKYLSKTFDF